MSGICILDSFRAPCTSTFFFLSPLTSVWGGAALLCALVYLGARMVPVPHKARREVQPTLGVVQNPHVRLVYLYLVAELSFRYLLSTIIAPCACPMGKKTTFSRSCTPHTPL